MSKVLFPPDDSRVRLVGSFEELVNGRFENGVNALCWPRNLEGDFSEVASLLEAGEGITTLDEEQLRALPVSDAGRRAVDVLLEDLRLLREQDREPVLNCIQGYPRDEDPGPVATDVFSFHADSAPVEADTWLCTYHGAVAFEIVTRQSAACRRQDRLSKSSRRARGCGASACLLPGRPTLGGASRGHQSRATALILPRRVFRGRSWIFVTVLFMSRAGYIGPELSCFPDVRRMTRR
jgi:hypothetical protein